MCEKYRHGSIRTVWYECDAKHNTTLRGSMEKRGRPLLQMAKIEKTFGATTALVDANIELFPGEVHTLLGENGSGKSTLVKILGGVHQPDSGKILLNGANLTQRSPRGASHYGIETVFQEVLTASHQSVLQNIWLGSDGIFRRRFKTATQRQRATRSEEHTSELQSRGHLVCR